MWFSLTNFYKKNQMIENSFRNFINKSSIDRFVRFIFGYLEKFVWGKVQNEYIEIMQFTTLQ